MKCALFTTTLLLAGICWASACIDNIDCDTTHVCDVALKECVPKPETGDTETGDVEDPAGDSDGASETDPESAAHCTTDSDCASDETCDQSAGVCRTQKTGFYGRHGVK